jgi:hypothetical protein
VPTAVPNGYGTQGLQPIGLAGNVTRLSLIPPPNHGKAMNDTNAPTSISLFDQGLVQVLQAAVTGLELKHPYVLALSLNPNGTGALGPLQQFMTNPAGSAIVNTVGPIRQILQDDVPPRYLVIVPGTAKQHGAPAQVQLSNGSLVE